MMLQPGMAHYANQRPVMVQMQPAMPPNMQPGMPPNMQPGMPPNMQPGMPPNMQPAYGQPMMI